MDTLEAVQEALDAFVASGTDTLDCVRWEIAMNAVIKSLPTKEQSRLKVVHGTFNKHEHRFLLVDSKKIVDPTVAHYLKKVLEQNKDWEAMMKEVVGPHSEFFLPKDALPKFPAGFTSYSTDGQITRFVYNELKATSDEVRKFYAW